MGSETQIVPALVGEAEPAMTFTRRLLEEGFYVQGIRPPTVPAGTPPCPAVATAPTETDKSILDRIGNWF